VTVIDDESEDNHDAVLFISFSYFHTFLRIYLLASQGVGVCLARAVRETRPLY